MVGLRLGVMARPAAFLWEGLGAFLQSSTRLVKAVISPGRLEAPAILYGGLQSDLLTLVGTLQSGLVLLLGIHEFQNQESSIRELAGPHEAAMGGGIDVDVVVDIR